MPVSQITAKDRASPIRPSEDPMSIRIPLASALTLAAATNMAEGQDRTRAAIRGGTAFVGVNRSASRAVPAGALLRVDLATRKVTASCNLGGKPDSVAISASGDMIAVAIENERDEGINAGAFPACQPSPRFLSARGSSVSRRTKRTPVCWDSICWATPRSPTSARTAPVR